MRFRFHILFLLLLVGFPTYGQQIDTLRAYMLDSVEISAAKADSPIKSTVPVQALSNEKMLQLGIQGIADALLHIAGITVRDYGGAGGMKTVSVRGIGSRHTGVVYDGVALSDCQTGEIDLSRYALNYVSNLSLTIGDGDDIFIPARNVTAAANVSFRTFQPPAGDRSAHLRTQIALGSWGTVNPSFYVGKRFSRQFACVAMAEYTYSNNNYPFTLYNVDLVTRERRNNSRMNAGHIETNAVYDFNDRHSLFGKIYYYDNDRQLPGIVHYYTDENNETLRERNAFVQLQYRGRFGNHWSLLMTGKFNWAMSDYHNGQPGGGVISAQYWQRESYGSTALLYTPVRWLAVDYSIDYVWQNLNSSLSVAERPFRHSLLQSLSSKMTLGRVTAIARLLGSAYFNGAKGGKSGQDECRLSPSISLSYRLIPHQEFYLRAFWKSIFRIPTFNELYYYHIGSTDLKPEKAEQFNLGITYATPDRQPSWFVRLTLDVYVNNVKDKIIAIPFNMFVWRMMNMAKVRAYGTDVTVDIKRRIAMRQSIGLTANYSWQRAENRINPESEYYKNQIAYTPVHSFSVTLTWLNPWANWAVSMDGQSERWATREHSTGTSIAGYTEMDVNVYRSFSLGKGILTARVGMMNATDKQYSIVAHYPMPGRSWRVAVKYEF